MGGGFLTGARNQLPDERGIGGFHSNRAERFTLSELQVRVIQRCFTS